MNSHASVSEAADTTGTVVTYVAPGANNTAADIVDRAGNAILGLINRAAHTAEADLQAAREVGERLADQLRTAQGRINELEAHVRYYRDRTERAEKWLNRISSEIQQSFAADNSDDAADESDGARRMAERLQNQDMTGAMPRQREASFLRRLSRN
jgi:chromosome segregation ATPase